MRGYLIATTLVGVVFVVGTRRFSAPEPINANDSIASAPNVEQPTTQVSSPLRASPPESLSTELSTAAVARAIEPTPTIEEIATGVAPTGVDEEARRAMIFEMKNWQIAEFPVVGEVAYIGTGTDGFDNYFYETENAQVFQWKKGEDLFVEQIDFPNGDRLVRRTELDESLKPEISFTRPDGTGGSIYLNARREVESFTYREKHRSTAYFYDEHGNIKDTFTFQ